MSPAVRGLPGGGAPGAGARGEGASDESAQDGDGLPGGPSHEAVSALTVPGGARLRLAEPGDLDEIWAIETGVFGCDAWSRALIRDELTAKYRHYLVLVDEAGAVRGYGGLLVVGAEGDIQTIAISPELRGRGEGRRLLRALLAEAARRGAREVFLEVRADNPIARSLYESLGFAELGIRPGYYQPDGIDAAVMRLEMVDQA